MLLSIVKNRISELQSFSIIKYFIIIKSHLLAGSEMQATLSKRKRKEGERKKKKEEEEMGEEERENRYYY